MADFNIFSQFGLREVANVAFESLDSGEIVMFIDTAKTSTIEQTSENTEARGGWGNPRLIEWDYNKEITVTLEDALMSSASLALLMGGELKNAAEGTGNGVTVYQNKDAVIITAANTLPTWLTATAYKWMNLTAGTKGVVDTDNPLEAASFDVGDHVRFFWNEIWDGTEVSDVKHDAVEITISPDKFPGLYRVIGDTKVRSRDDGEDYAFQFTIHRAKISSAITLSMSADGDPSTFSMTLRCMKDPTTGKMMSLTRYNMKV